MKLYHSRGSRSVRVLWLLEEFGLDYEIETMPFDPEALRVADYLEVDSFGKLPVLVDDALTMFESVAIVQYLLDRYGGGRLMPERGTAEHGRFLQWLQFGETTLMGPVSQLVQHLKLLPPEQRNPELADGARRVFAQYAHVMEEALEGRHYLLGETFTAADIVVGYALLVADDCGALPADALNLRAYYDRLRVRPAFARATA